MATYPVVDLDQIEIDRDVGHLLPSEIAYRYHALPVAADGNQVTVAIAYPEDQTAIEVLESIFNAPVFLIQAEKEKIDHQLQVLWAQEFPRLKFMFWSSLENDNKAFILTKGIARPMDAELERIECPVDDQKPLAGLTACLKGGKPDLLMMQTLQPYQMLKKLVNHIQPSGLPDILLLPEDLRLPIHKLLLITDGKLSCGAGVTWAVRLSQIDRVDVQLFPVLPPTPPCYGSLLYHDLAAIKSGNDPMGKDLRMQSKRLEEKAIKVSCRLRIGDPYSQIREEITAVDPDLILLPAITSSGKLTWAMLDILNALYKYIDIPILITH